MPPEQPQPEAVRSRAAELLQRIAATEESVGKSGEIIHAASNRDDFDRSFISHIVMLAYLGVILAAFILFAIRGWHAADPAAWTDIIRDAGDLIKTAVIPIVTLVLGYYFGKSGNN